MIKLFLFWLWAATIVGSQAIATAQTTNSSPTTSGATNSSPTRSSAATSSSTTNAPEAGTDAASEPGVFYDKDLDLRFDYPIEMRTEDPLEEMRRGHRNVYGVSAKNDPEHQQAERCMRPLFYAELSGDKAPQRPADIGGMWTDDSDEYKRSRKPEPVSAQISIMEMMRDRVGEENIAKHEDDVLRAIAQAFVSAPGIQRMPKPVWYDVGGQKIHMNAGVGRMIANGKLAPAPIIVMAMSTDWRGHLLSWLFTSNDAEIFNQITKSRVRFGDGPSKAMFPGNFAPQGR